MFFSKPGMGGMIFSGVSVLGLSNVKSFAKEFAALSRSVRLGRQNFSSKNFKIKIRRNNIFILETKVVLHMSPIFIFL